MKQELRHTLVRSVVYSSDQMQLKTIPADERVYKFYFKQLQNGNIFLGTKWDADPSWMQALINQVRGMTFMLKGK